MACDRQSCLRDMGQLVEQHRTAPILGPGVGDRGKKDGARADAERHRHRLLPAAEKTYRALDAEACRRVAQQTAPVEIRHRVGTPDQTRDGHPLDDHLQQEQQRSGRIDRDRRGPPRESRRNRGRHRRTRQRRRLAAARRHDRDRRDRLDTLRPIRATGREAFVDSTTHVGRARRDGDAPGRSDHRQERQRQQAHERERAEEVSRRRRASVPEDGAQCPR